MAYNTLSETASHKSILIYTKINLKTNGKKKHFLSRMATNKHRKNVKLENPFGKYVVIIERKKLPLAF